jgi:hypothetical protein
MDIEPVQKMEYGLRVKKTQSDDFSRQRKKRPRPEEKKENGKKKIDVRV